MIDVYWTSENNVFVFDVEDIIKLRREYRIVGSLAGIYPRRPFQIQTKFLPLQLSPDEAALLIEKAKIQLNYSPSATTNVDPATIKQFYEFREKLCNEQAILLKERRKQEILKRADEIYEAKKQKYLKKAKKLNKKKRKLQSENSENDKKLKLDSIVDENSDKNSNLDSIAEEIIDSENHDENEVTGKEKCVTEVTPPCAKIIPDEESDANCNKSNASENLEKEENKVCFASNSEYEGDIDMESTSQFSETNISEVNESQNETSSKDNEIQFLDKQAVIEVELAKIPDYKKHAKVQLFTEYPWKHVIVFKKFSYPSTEKERLRFAIFKDLWEKKYYVTNGLKFGADFLVYEGDPFKYHSTFLVVVVSDIVSYPAIDIATFGRMAHQVKKTVVLASYGDTHGEIDYMSINWTGESY